MFELYEVLIDGIWYTILMDEEQHKMVMDSLGSISNSQQEIKLVNGDIVKTGTINEVKTIIDEIFEEFAKEDLDSNILSNSLILNVIKYTYAKGYIRGGLSRGI